MISFDTTNVFRLSGDVKFILTGHFPGFSKVDIHYQDTYIGMIMIGYYGDELNDLCLHDRDGERFMFNYDPDSVENVQDFHYIAKGNRYNDDIIIDVSDECDMFQKGTISDYNSSIAIETIQYYNELRSVMVDFWGSEQDICLTIRNFDKVRIFVDSIRSYNDSRSTEGL